MKAEQFLVVLSIPLGLALVSCAPERAAQEPRARAAAPAVPLKRIEINDISNDDRSVAGYNGLDEGRGRMRDSGVAYRIGQDIETTGRIVAGRENFQGEAEKVLIFGNNLQVQIADQTSRNRLMPHLGERVHLRGRVLEAEPGKVVIDVRDYRILQ